MSISKFIPWGLIGVVFFILSPPVSAVLTVSNENPSPSLIHPDEVYPSSRFGSPPEMPDLGGHIPETKGGRRIASDTMNPKPENSREGVQEIALIAGDLGFFPKTVFVTQGIPVRVYVTGASKKTLCVMMDDFQIKKQVRAHRIEELSFTPTTPGQFRFYCPVNGMEGTILVKEGGGLEKGLGK